jgi:ubiquinone biosynthesis protein UbiJ
LATENLVKAAKVAAKCAVYMLFVLICAQFIIWNRLMKFRFLLWMLGRMMSKASKTNSAFQKQLDGKDLTFMLHTLDGKVARHFVVANNRLESRSGAAQHPDFSIGFKDSAFGFATMNAKNKQLAFMLGIQDKNIQIQGNSMLVMWFQGLMKYLMPRKPKPQAD